MSGIISQPYPYFEPGFPLRSAALNQLVKYGENEERRAHLWLTGSGCVYGLQVRLNKTSGQFILEKGVGITSLGYLVVIEEDQELVISETKPQLIPADFRGTAEVIFNTTKASADTFSDAEELKLLPTGSSGMKINDLKALAAKKLSVVLFVDINGNRTESGCQNCDKSLSATANIRALLLSEADLKKMDDALQLTTVNAEDNLCKQVVIDPSYTGYPYIDRFIPDSSNVANWPAYTARYRDIIRTGLDSVINSLKRLTVSDPGLKRVFGPDLPVDIILTALKNHLNEISYFLQYVHAFARDLINTYQELVETRFGEIINYMPPGHCFPRHLVLGSLALDSDDNVEFNLQKRTPFFRPPYAGFQDIELEKAKFLFNRLRILLEKSLFVDPLGAFTANQFFEIRTDLKITPCAAVNAALGQQAVPYYYQVDDRFRTAWDFQLYRTERWRGIPSYLRYQPNAADLLNPQPFDQPLLTQTSFDRADFYRIEGQVGKTLTDINASSIDRGGNLISSNLHTLRNNLSLPFAIKLCTLAEATLKGRPIPLLQTFLQQHPGLEHQGGVPKGGTFVLVIDGGAGETNQNIIGDFCLPYYACCKAEATIVEFMVESPNNFSQTIQNNIEVYEFPVRYTGAEGKLHIYFKNLSQNAESLSWSIDNKLTEAKDAALAFDHEFVITGDSAAYNLTLSSGEGVEDVVSITKKIILIREEIVPVIAEFIVESPNDFVQTRDVDIEVYTFPVRPSSRNRFVLSLHLKNISRHADTYAWQVDDGEREPDVDLALTQDFEMPDEKPVNHEIRLFASRADQPEVVVIKRIVLERAVEIQPLPVIAEFIVESPNDFLQTWEDNMEVYTFPVKPTATGSFVLPLRLKNISQHADTYAWRVDDGEREPDVDLAFARDFEVPAGEPTSHEIRLFAARANQPEVVIVKRIVLERVDFLIDFNFSATDNGLATFESETTIPYNGIPTKKISLRLTDQGIETIVTKWLNQSLHADTFHWEVSKLDPADLIAESNAKTAFRPTLLLENNAISSFVLVLEGSSTAKGLTGQKVILLDVLPFDQ